MRTREANEVKSPKAAAIGVEMLSGLRPRLRATKVIVNINEASTREVTVAVSVEANIKHKARFGSTFKGHKNI